MRLSKLYPVLHSVVKAHHINSRLLEREEYSPKNVKVLTLLDLVNLLFITLDAISEIVEVFGDWFCEMSFLFHGHRLDIDNSCIEYFPFPLYVGNASFIVHIPYMTDEAGLYFASILRGLGYSVFCSLELFGSVDFYKFRRLTLGLKI